MSLTKAIEKVQQLARDLPPAVMEQEAAIAKHFQILKTLPLSQQKVELLESLSEVHKCHGKIIRIIRKLGDV